MLDLDPVSQLVTVDDPSPTISVLWDQAVQQAIINTSPGPTIGSRASAVTHTAMYDAWASFDPIAQPTQLGDAFQRPAQDNTDENKSVAMSYAAFTVLSELFPTEIQVFEGLMEDLGLDTDVELDLLPEDSPILTGLAAGEAVNAFRLADGANQANGYADTTGYEPVNPSPLEVNDITRWTPENLPIDPEDENPEQTFLTPHWGTVTPFGLEEGGAVRPEAPEPFFLVDGATLDVEAGTITLADQSVLAVTRDLVGTVINPGFVAQAERIVSASADLTDEQKLIAEFWEDGGGTSFPPGTWMTFGQFVSVRDDNSLDQDAAMFFALSNALMDAGIATWEAKAFYDYARPVRAIRDLGQLGLIGAEGTDDLTDESGFVVEAWAGPGLGTQTILAENFLTYQMPGSDTSPPFAEYTSGHSAFSAAGALILAGFTGSDAFGASVTFEPGTSRFEPGVTPASEVTLAWDSFSAAADEGGLSRIFGGIHFDDGDINGRQLGSDVSRAAFTEAQRYINGVAGDEAPTVSEAPSEVIDTAILYQIALGRFADRGGLNFWESLAGTAEGLVAVANAFLSSPELARNFSALREASVAEFADQILFNAGLDEATSELDEALEAQLEAGASRAEVLAGAVNESEIRDALAYLNALAETDSDDFWFT